MSSRQVIYYLQSKDCNGEDREIIWFANQIIGSWFVNIPMDYIT